MSLKNEMIRECSFLLMLNTINCYRSIFNVVKFVQVEGRVIYYCRWTTASPYVCSIRFSWPLSLMVVWSVCYFQERSVGDDKFSFAMYFCYLVYAPLHIAGPIISFNAFASQVGCLDCFTTNLFKQLFFLHPLC